MNWARACGELYYASGQGSGLARWGARSGLDAAASVALALELVGPSEAGEPPLLIEKLGTPGLWILLVLSTLISFMLATEMAFYPAAIAFRDWIAERQGKGGESPPAAIFGWLRRLVVGLWSFLRGADLEPCTVPAAVLDPAPPATKKRSRASGRLAPDRTAELQQRRAELARLRARRETAGSRAPAWLHAYIAELEAEIRRLEE